MEEAANKSSSSSSSSSTSPSSSSNTVPAVAGVSGTVLLIDWFVVGWERIGVGLDGETVLSFVLLSSFDREYSCLSLSPLIDSLSPSFLLCAHHSYQLAVLSFIDCAKSQWTAIFVDDCFLSETHLLLQERKWTELRLSRIPTRSRCSLVRYGIFTPLITVVIIYNWVVIVGVRCFCVGKGWE